MIFKILLLPFKIIYLIFEYIAKFILSIIFGVIKWFLVRAIVVGIVLLFVLYMINPALIPIVGQDLANNSVDDIDSNNSTIISNNMNNSISESINKTKQKASNKTKNYIINTIKNYIDKKLSNHTVENF
jgi:hypothetical protein